MARRSLSDGLKNRTVQDNSSIWSKLRLRQSLSRELHFALGPSALAGRSRPSLTVYDAFPGEQKMRQGYPSGTEFVEALQPADVYDIDPWGSPWEEIVKLPIGEKLPCGLVWTDGSALKMLTHRWLSAGLSDLLGCEQPPIRGGRRNEVRVKMQVMAMRELGRRHQAQLSWFSRTISGSIFYGAAVFRELSPQATVE